MTVTIPRAEIADIMERHGDHWPLDEDPPAETVREVAAELSPDYLDEAQDLNALVDRIEATA